MHAFYSYAFNLSLRIALNSGTPPGIGALNVAGMVVSRSLGLSGLELSFGFSDFTVRIETSPLSNLG